MRFEVVTDTETFLCDKYREAFSKFQRSKKYSAHATLYKVDVDGYELLVRILWKKHRLSTGKPSILEDPTEQCR